MAKKKTSKKKTSKAPQTRRRRSSPSEATPEQSPDWIRDPELARRIRMNRSGNDLPPDTYAGVIEGGTLDPVFGGPGFSFLVKIVEPASFAGRVQRIQYGFNQDFSIQMLGDALEVLGFDREDLELDKLPKLCKTLEADPIECEFEARKNKSSYINYFFKAAE